MWNQLEMLWSHAPEQIPLWLKIGYTAFVCFLIPPYIKHYGPGNFLWFSDTALLVTVAALWLESPLLTSIAALAVLVADIAWNIDFLSRLTIGRSITGLSAYMFNPQVSRFIRALSLFHVFFPVLLLWMLYKLGYDKRALLIQTPITWVVLPLSYFFTRRVENVNWVHGFGNQPYRFLSPPLHILLLMIAFPVIVYLPTHFLLQLIF